MKHNVILIAMAIVMTLAACSENKIVYRGDGDKPQTSYEATLIKYKNRSAKQYFYRNEAVKEFVYRSNTRPMLAEEMLIGAMGTNAISFYDTIFDFVQGKDVYTFSVKYDKAVVPDYRVLFRDMVRYGGMQCDTAVRPAYRLVVADTMLYQKAHINSSQFKGSNINRTKWVTENSWMYEDLEDEIDGMRPQRLASVVSALRYSWHLPVLVDHSMNAEEWLNVSEDFATKQLGFEEIQQELLTRFGMTLVPAGRDMVVLTVSEKK